MNQYIGTKVINAKPMNRLEYNQFRGWVLPDDENGTDEGFLVEYVDGGKANTAEFDGYVSWSPKDVFERAYKASGEMSFVGATEFMKMGCKATRKGWNGSGMYVVLMNGHPNGVPANVETAKKHGISEMSIVKIRPYFQLFTALGDIAMWVPSVGDVLAEDWEVL